jgi:hypothetical protein
MKLGVSGMAVVALAPPAGNTFTAAAAEAKQRMEVSIAADIVSGKMKPKVKRNCQQKSAKQIDEDDYNDRDSS